MSKKLKLTTAFAAFNGALATLFGLVFYDPSSLATVRLFDATLALFIAGCSAVYGLLKAPSSKKNKQKR